MLVSLQFQFNVLFFSLLSGVLIGVLFDVYRVLRGIRKSGNIFTFISDLLFWLLASIVVFAFLLYTSYAYIGIYVYLYIALGTYCYYKILSKPLIFLLLSVSKTSTKLIRTTKNYILYPFQLLFYNINSKKHKNQKK